MLFLNNNSFYLFFRKARCGRGVVFGSAAGDGWCSRLEGSAREAATPAAAGQVFTLFLLKWQQFQGEGVVWCGDSWTQKQEKLLTSSLSVVMRLETGRLTVNIISVIWTTQRLAVRSEKEGLENKYFVYSEHINASRLKRESNHLCLNARLCRAGSQASKARISQHKCTQTNNSCFCLHRSFFFILIAVHLLAPLLPSVCFTRLHLPVVYDSAVIRKKNLFLNQANPPITRPMLPVPHVRLSTSCTAAFYSFVWKWLHVSVKGIAMTSLQLNNDP